MKGNEQADQMAKSVLETNASCNSVGYDDEIKSYQQGDIEMNKLKHLIMTGKLYGFARENDVVYKLYKNEKLLVVPKELRMKLLRTYHDHPLTGGHQGPFKTFITIGQWYWWRRMRNDITDYISSCHKCQLYKRGKHVNYGYMQPIKSSQVFEKLVLISWDHSQKHQNEINGY